MKHFIYTYSEHTPRGGHTKKTVRVYRISRGVPKFCAGATDTFVSEFQLVLQTMADHKMLPSRAFERNQFGGWKYGVPSALEEAGIATVRRVS